MESRRQYEEVGGGGRGNGYGGGSNEDGTAGPLEFVPEVEHPGGFHEGGDSRPLSTSD